MNIFIVILLVLACLITLILIIALFMKREHFVKCETVINAPKQKIYDYLKLLRNQETFNRGAQEDSNRKKEFKGTDGTVGYIYSWSGNKNAGEGEKEIIALIEGERVETEIRFVKPMKTSARIVMNMVAISESQTRLEWINSGTLNYPLNLMIPVFQKMFAKEMEKSLLALKGILEK